MLMDELLQCFHKVSYAKLVSFTKGTNQPLSAGGNEIGGAFTDVNYCLLTLIISAMDENTLAFHGNVATFHDYLAFASVEGKTIDLRKRASNLLTAFPIIETHRQSRNQA